jgi:hypothetical protein
VIRLREREYLGSQTRNNFRNGTENAIGYPIRNHLNKRLGTLWVTLDGLADTGKEFHGSVVNSQSLPFFGMNVERL